MFYYWEDDLSYVYCAAMCGCNTGYPFCTGAVLKDWYAMLDMGGPL